MNAVFGFVFLGLSLFFANERAAYLAAHDFCALADSTIAGELARPLFDDGRVRAVAPLSIVLHP